MSLSSRTYSGTTRSCSSRAATSAGWSCTRRSRRNQTMAVEVVTRSLRRTGGPGSTYNRPMGEQQTGFPLFPLGIVAVPGEIVPLHIFEERYKAMIGECLDGGRQFGIVWAGDGGLRGKG